MSLLRIVLISVFSALLCRAELDSDLRFDDKVVSELAKSIELYHEEVIRRMPDDIKNQVLKMDKFDNMANVPPESQSWLEQVPFFVGSTELARSVDKVLEMLGRTGDRIHGEDMEQILKKAFWCRLHGKPFDLEETIKDYVIYWREHAIPNVEFSPQGQNEIRWIWRLPIKDRPHGILNVGLDVKKRTFICFDRKVGVFFPEGEIMERIYREIVQVPSEAGELTGHGRIDKK